MCKRPNEKTKLQTVRRILKHEITVSEAAQLHSLHSSSVRKWVDNYLHHGKAGLCKRYTHYSATFKLKVLKHMRQAGLSQRETALLFDIRERAAIGRWERQYHSGGLAALEPKPKGCKLMPAKPSASKPSISLPRPDEELSRDELLEELAYLRAENDYLKKLDALIQGRRATAQGKKPKSSRN